MPEASEAPIPDERVRPITPHTHDPDRSGPGPLPVGNAAIARMMRRASAPMPALTMFGGNAEIARLVEGDGAPPAPGGGGAAPAPAGLATGAHGEAVRDAQIKLSRVQASALPLTEDGHYGPQTEAAVRTFQTSQAITPATGILDAGTKAALDVAFAALPPPVRTPLALGATGADVGFAQQKLNALGASPRLSINAVYDNPMFVAVVSYEFGVMHRFPTGVVDAAMWAALDAGVSGGFVAPEGVSGTQVEQKTSSGTADSLGTQVAGTSLHPVVGVGGLTQGPAVKELQQKLNTAGAAPPLVVDGSFGPKTTTALRTFQTSRVPPLAGSGTADKATWDALDTAAPGSMVGMVERQWTESVGGHTYSMVGADASRYSWEILPDKMQVTVKVNFVGLPAPGSWFGFVPAVWNQYMGVDGASGKKMPVDFRMVRGSGGDAMTVEVKPGSGRANAGEWFVADPNASSTIPHEFGHLIGLQDEYQLHPGDFVRVTGHEPQVGDTAGAGLVPATVAANLRAAIMARSSANALAASNTAGVRNGAFAQRVVEEYAKLGPGTVPAVAAVPGPPPVPGIPAAALTGDLLHDLDEALPADSDRYETIQTFSYSSGSVMGDPGRVTDPHDHGTQPRHIAEFMAILGRALGGTWEAKRR